MQNFSDCAKACCDDAKCNAAFYTKKNCLTIQCFSDDACSAGKKTGALTDAFLINLRTQGEINCSLENAIVKGTTSELLTAFK